MRRRMWLVGAVLGLAVASPLVRRFVVTSARWCSPGWTLRPEPSRSTARSRPVGLAARLTAINGQVWNECPTWSSDGQLIYFDSFDRGVAGPSHIYRMTAIGGSRTLVDGQDAPRVCRR